MERLTKYSSNREARTKTNIAFSPIKNQECLDRLAALEDILGDDYDLTRLRELIEADRNGRCEIIPLLGKCKVRCLKCGCVLDLMDLEAP